MQLPGRLSGTTLGDLLGRAHRARASGTLELIETTGPSAGRRHRIQLDRGLVAAVDSGMRVARLGDILREQGFIGDDSLRRLSRGLAEAPGSRTGEILVRHVRISPSLVSAALRRQLRLKLDELFRLEDAEVRFHVPRPCDDPTRPVPLSPREFLHGRPRARDRRPGAAPAPRRSVGREKARARAFGVLGLDVGATREAVQRAFRRLAAAVHPDRHPDASALQRAELMKRFAELSAAYHLLVT
jgi:hypothetical protein